MKYRLSKRAALQLEALPQQVQKRLRKQLDFLVTDLRHPSLRAKKYDEAQDVWQARIDRNHRFYFQIQGDTYFVLAIVAHPK